MWEIKGDTTVTDKHPALQHAAGFMIRHLQKQGLPARLWESYVVFGVAEYWGRCREATIRPGDGGVFVTSLAFDLYTDRDRTYTVTDIVAGMGGSAQASMEDAACNYLNQVFTAFHAMHDPRLIPEDSPKIRLDSYSDVTRRNTHWDVFTGGATAIASGETAEQFLTALRKQPPLTVILDEVTGLLSADDRLHWVKIFGCRLPTGQVVSECALDNRLSPAANRLLDRFPWPTAAFMQSFRQFYVLRPQR